jgi:large subunit ribosomal protein L24
MLKIKVDDEVVITTGRDKGKRGKITRILGGKVVVAGVNVAKRHQKPVPQRNVTGGIVEKELPIDASNVAIWNPKTQKADKVGVRLDDGGKKIRVFKSTQEAIS